MTKEKLYELIGDIDEKYIEDANNKKIESKRSWLKWMAVAACLCVLLVGKKAYYTLYPTDFQTLLSSKDFEFMESSENLQIIDIHFEEKIAEYKKLDMIISHKIAPFAGKEFYPSKVTNFLGDSCSQSYDTKWFYPVGITNLKYLISSTNGIFTLWEFNRFYVPDTETYTYADILTTIYNVHSEKDIVSITTIASDHNQTDLGKLAQKEVGTHTVTERKDIAAFYNIAINTVYLGNIHAKTNNIDADPYYGPIYESFIWGNRFKYSFSTDDIEKWKSIDSTYGRRILSIELKDGTTIDSWRYDALSGLFYERGGIYSYPLEDADVFTLNEIFDIK